MESLRDAFPGVLATRYLSVAGLTVLLWDHCLTFEQERVLIWPSRACFVKSGFLFNRYLVPAILLVNTHTQSGMSSAGLSDTVCKVWTMVVCFSSILSIGICHWLILLKLWTLWDRRRDILLGTCLAFFIAQGGSIVFMAFTAREVWSSIHYHPMLHMCTLADKPEMLIGLWTLIMVFELLVSVMVALNGLSRPRESHTVLMKVLYRDGICFFVVITTVRILNLVLAIKAPASQTLLGIYCIWCLITAIVSRMMINLREAKLVMRNNDCEYEDESTCMLHTI